MDDPIYGYVPKDDLAYFVISPVPEDTSRYYKVLYDPSFDYRNKRYDPETGTWGACAKALNKAALRQRLEAYKTESDPLFMEYQFDQTPESEKAWRDKVQEIKDRYPIST